MNSKSIASVSRGFLASAIALAALLALPGTARAERNLVVLEFEGPRGSQFRREVIKLIEDDNELVSPKRFERARDDVRKFRPNAKGYAAVAKELDLDGIVLGEVERRGKRFILTVRIREGMTGEETREEIVFRGRRPKFSGKSGRRFRRNLRSAIDALPDASELVDEAKEADEEEPDESEELDEEADADPEEVADAGDSAGGDVAISSAVLADRKVRSRGVELEGGLSFTSRSLSFTADPGIADDPQGYSGKLVPGLYVDAEVYPMALDLERNGWMRNVGLTAYVDKVLKIESKLQNDMDVVLGTSQTAWGIGAVYRHNFGDTPTSPTLKASLRYSSLSFTIDESMAEGVAISLPDVGYTYIDPGLSLRYPVTDQIAIDAEGRFFIVRGTGEIQDTSSYGGAKVSAYALSGGASYRVNDDLAVSAGARFQRYVYTFNGSGDLTDRDSDGTVDVGGATDRYLALYLTAGYLF